MSQRLGMADGRCFTLNSSANLTNNFIMQKNGISYDDNYSYRQLLQKGGPELIQKLQNEYQGNKCDSCDKIFKPSKTY
jgi:hypothetical protein